ncbi:phage tail tape measure protein [Janthinobacterium sp. BJB401]|uniref:phage tail tape measure protein n=1 Tax=Janthinobacterium sp. BJB401 TaxID=2745934 RepID=UPI001595F603|nr:phage tail protein [Janthinobacterium sp. BJB401]NVI81922.1 phage tail protein [Janthinobacterium sp. BJB401]
MSGSSNTAKALKATSDRLRELNTQQRNLGKFRELHSGINATRTKLKEAQDKLNDLAAKMKQTTTPTRALTREFNAAVKVTQALTLKGREQSQQFRVLRTSLKDAGIDTRQLGKAQEWLKNSIQLTNVELASQQKRLAASAAKQQRVTNATQHADKLRNKAGNMAMAGAGATATGAVMGAPVIKGLNEAKHYQTEVGRVNALGLGDKVSAEAVAFARNMKTYGTSQLDNLQLMRDGMSAFADVHHAEMVAPTLAKMKFANHAFFGEAEGVDNERKFMDMLKVIELRGGLESKEKFEAQANIVQQVITATGGRVGPNEWLNMIKTGGIAAKGLKDDAFYYQMEPLVQEMSGNRVGTSLMSAYQNLYQGRTTKRSARKLEEFGLIGDKSKVKHDKAGQVSFLDPGALLGAELFRENQFEWLEKVLLPQLAKKGITEKKQVLDAIGSIFSNRTASNLYSQMYLQRVQIHKNEKLNRGAADIGQLDKLGRDSAAGKELEAQSKLANLKLTMGEKILPLYAQGLELAISAVQRLNGFMERNPTVAKVMITAFAVLAALMLVLGPLMLGIAAMIGPYAMLHVMFAKIGVTGGVLTPILRGLGGAFMWAGRAVLWLGRALLMTPIGIAITVIASAAFLIYKYWEPIKAFFGGLWSDVKAAFAGGFTGINSLIADWSPLGLFYRAFAGVLGWFGIALPARFTDFAASIRGRFAKGLAPLAGFFTGIWSQIKTAFAGGIGGVSALIANWTPLALFYRAFAGVLGWFGITLPAKFTDFGASILQRITASWAPISAFFADIWSRLRTVCAGGMGSITALIINWSPVGVFYQAFAGVMSWFGIKLPAQFTEFGANILRGLVNGITGSMGAVKDAISNAGSSTIAWFKEKLGIHSPSRVFAQLGDYTMQGLAVGLDRSEGAPIAKVSGLAQRLTQLGAGIAIGTAIALPASAFDTRAPLPVGGFGAGMTIQGDKIEITFHVQAGTDPQAIARAVSVALDQRDREKAARIRSSLRDHD